MVKYLVLSDIHFGHNINKTCSIIENLDIFFNTNAKLFKDLNIIFLAGDVFDRLLGNNNKDYIYAIRWLTDLLVYCTKKDVTLRVLEGTPSHDWQQMQVLDTIITRLGLNIDYKYINTLCIEHMDKYNLDVLYLPDEYKHKADDTWKDVQKLLVEHKLQQVDIAIMHGQFTYQLPVLLPSSHNEHNYLSIVKYYINIGHIHTHSVKDRILAQGSFDRLAHGQEEDKGGILVTLDDNPRWEFIVNKKAMAFNTYKFDSSSTMEDIHKVLTEAKKKLPAGSNIRVILKDNNLVGITEDMRKSYPMFNIKIEKTTQADKQVKILEDNHVVHGFAITKDNIVDLLNQEIGKYNFSKEELVVYKRLLKEILEGE